MGMIKIPNNSAVFQNTLNLSISDNFSFCGFNASVSLSKSGVSFATNICNPSYKGNGISFYKGAIPTQAELDAMSGTAAIVQITSLPRYADLLVIHQGIGASYVNFVNNGMQIELPPAIATQSGQATWFMILGTYNSAETRNQALIGTVTGLGGGGDIELTTTNIIAGAQYKLPMVQINFPTKFTW